MHKRVIFASRSLPYLLLLPQLLVIALFFYWPSVQAVWQSMFIPDPFGLSTQFVGWDNFVFLLEDSYYRNSFWTTAVFGFWVTVLSMGSALYLAVMADRIVKGSGTYHTLLIWPYAVAPAVAGILWVFLFNPSLGVIAYWLKALGYDWNHVLRGDQAMALVVIASAWKQVSYNFLFFLAGLQSIPKSVIEAAAIDGAHPL